MVNDTITLAQPPWKIARENKSKIKQYLPLVIIVNTCCGATCTFKIRTTPTHLHSHNSRAIKVEAVKVCKT